MRIQHSRQRPTLRPQPASTSTSMTSHGRNYSQQSIDCFKSNRASVIFGEQTSDFLFVKPPAKEDSTFSVLSPDSTLTMHQRLRPETATHKATRSLRILISPDHSELSYNNKKPVKPSTPLQKHSEQQDYDIFKKSFDAVVLDKDKHLSKSSLKIKVNKTMEENLPQADELNTDRMIEKLDNKYKGFNPKKSHHTRNPSSQTMTSFQNSNKKHVDQVKRMKIDVLNSNLRSLRNDKVISVAKGEVHRASLEAAEHVDKYKAENQMLSEENKMLKEKVTDLESQNSILTRKNTMLHHQILELDEKRDHIAREFEKLELFIPMYEALTSKFPNEDITSILKKYDCLQDYCYTSAKRAEDIEEEKQLIKAELAQTKKELYGKDTRIQNEFNEVNNLEKNHRKKMESLELLVATQHDYRSEYQVLSHKIYEVFTECSDALQIYGDFKKHPELNPTLDTPVDCLEILKRCVKISTPKTMSEYLKKIIISANLLRRKFFKQSIVDKFDPDELYEQCSRYIEHLQNKLKRQTDKKR